MEAPIGRGPFTEFEESKLRELERDENSYLEDNARLQRQINANNESLDRIKHRRNQIIRGIKPKPPLIN